MNSPWPRLDIGPRYGLNVKIYTIAWTDNILCGRGTRRLRIIRYLQLDGVDFRSAVFFNSDVLLIEKKKRLAPYRGNRQQN